VQGLHKGPRTWFGVQVGDAEPRELRGQGYDGGIIVNSVTELSPAERAGIKEGDIIVEIGGSPMVKASSLRDFLARSSPGQKVVVTLIRQGELWEKDLVIGRTPEKSSGR
ncbi:MAG: PDZ domain-containing protein, partial [Planctomycetes bacterium]|nr:PDZ domain-containing protein [Planctomycetota bacterium]